MYILLAIVLVNQGYGGYSDSWCEDELCYAQSEYYEWEHWEVLGSPTAQVVLPDDTHVSIPDGRFTITQEVLE